MSLPLVFRPIAQAEFEEAATWYESQQPGLGKDFVTEVQKVLDTIVGQPDRYPFASGELRERLFPVFPTAHITESN